MRIKTTIPITLCAAALAVPAHAADSGGAAASAPAKPQSVGCSERCADLSAAREGSTVRVAGSDMGAVRTVVFLGAKGGADDVTAPASKVGASAVYAVVPSGADSGPLELVNGDGTASVPSPPLEIDRGPTTTAKQGTVPPVDAKVEVRKAFYDGTRPAALNFLVRGDQPVDVSVALVSRMDGTTVAAWAPGLVQPGTVQTVSWNGNVQSTGKAASQGRYEFRIYTGDTTARTAQADTPPTAAQSFLFLDHIFPVRGKHDYGDAEAAFGARRNGHVHQGQDVMADCGLPLVAARGGTVKFRGTQANAGNYVVVDEAGTGVDDVYMHLRDTALVAKGDRVRTGDPIGFVGRTGDASACHLHFEQWSSPGWYTGGKPFDPLADLRAWDQYS